MIYEYTAYSTDKRIVKGTIEGATEASAEEALEQYLEDNPPKADDEEED